MAILKINGTDKNFDTLPATLTDLLVQMKIDAATVVAEIDGRIIKRSDFATEKIFEGQKIELIRLVGGG